MTRNAHFVLFPALLLASVLPLAAATPLWRGDKSPPPLTRKEILSRMDEAGKHLKTLSADLTYTKVTVLVNDRSSESGKLYFRNSRSPEIRINFTKPDSKTFLLRKNVGELYLPKVNQIQQYDLTHHQGLVQQFLLLGFGSDIGDLKKAYDVKYLKEERLAGNEAALLELTPRNSGVAAQLTKIQLWINEESWVPLQQEFFQPGGDYMIAQYSDVKINRPLSSSLFRIHAKGAKVIKMQ
jgi:outer membrane lipoprotein-sorting protein